ncbi:MAG: cytochrome c oxidase accessory protein CcoG, partial [Candidatus Sericytochromatia bacterium]|nr:cytochrome c oxidase accessory protein CcoG [Candidatus Sericytochromatia bacterium]
MAAPRTHTTVALLTGRPRIQTQWVWGPHERRRWLLFAVKLGTFLSLPWITVGGTPALWFDIPHRRYHVFGHVFWPQDFYMLGLVLAVAAMLVFTTTALVGRVFCGHACPHTLFWNLFAALEHLIEGDRPARLALDAGQAGWPARARRVGKHAAWLSVAGVLGLTFVSYFLGVEALLHRLTTLTLTGPPLVTGALVAGLVYLFAGHLRDFICTTTCPYGRFQGAMQDRSSLVVTYDALRGEPRGKGKQQVARGGCVDCGQCVTVCPVGIDIRNGPQYECTTCARCIDACDQTMAKLHAQPGLIRFASAREWAAHVAEPRRAWPPALVHRYWRPRLAWYGVVLVALLGTITTLVLTRPLLGLAVTRDRATVIRLADGRAANLYHLKLLNKDTRPHTLTLEL